MQEYAVKTPSSNDDIFARPPRALALPARAVEEDDDLFTVHTRACATCGAEFQTCGKGKHCSGCLAQSSAPTGPARITCRVCEAKATVGIDHPALLCEACLEGLDATRDRVQAWLAAALASLDANQAAWDALAAASDRWPAIQAAIIAVAEKRATQAAFDATWAKRKAEGGELSKLLCAYEGYAEECDRLGAELARLQAAQAEINQAFLSEEL